MQTQQSAPLDLPACASSAHPHSTSMAVNNSGFAFALDEYTKKDCFFSPLLVHEHESAGHGRRPKEHKSAKDRAHAAEPKAPAGSQEK